jgi:hypothetical protein
MLCCLRPRRRRTRHGGGATAAAALVHPWSAAIFAAAAAPGTVSEDLAVTIPAELEAQILRYYHVEKWPVGTIAKHLRVHHTTVSRVLLQAGLPRFCSTPDAPRPIRFCRSFAPLWSAFRR